MDNYTIQLEICIDYICLCFNKHGDTIVSVTLETLPLLPDDFLLLSNDQIRVKIKVTDVLKNAFTYVEEYKQQIFEDSLLLPKYQLEEKYSEKIIKEF